MPELWSVDPMSEKRNYNYQRPTDWITRRKFDTSMDKMQQKYERLYDRLRVEIRELRAEIATLQIRVNTLTELAIERED